MSDCTAKSVMLEEAGKLGGFRGGRPTPYSPASNSTDFRDDSVSEHW
ncbi:hypothetical protein ACFXPY_14685 [Streptomyces sp. NPDC059153]